MRCTADWVKTRVGDLPEAEPVGLARQHPEDRGGTSIIFPAQKTGRLGGRANHQECRAS